MLKTSLGETQLIRLLYLLTNTKENSLDETVKSQSRDGGQRAVNVCLAGRLSFDQCETNLIYKFTLIDEHKNIDQTQALKAVVPGFEKAKLRNFGMTIGNKDV